MIFVPLDAGRRQVIGRNYAKDRSVSSIFVKFAAEDIEPGIERISALLRQRHRLPEDQDDFSIRNLPKSPTRRHLRQHALACSRRSPPCRSSWAASGS